MSLNITIVSGRDPINGEPMEVGSIGSFSELPMDVIQIIFQNLKTDLPAIALVCKKWQAVADDEAFCKMIRPAQAFGTQEWKEYIGVDAGAELRLPRRAYGDLEKEGGLLTFIPDKVKVTKENGVLEELPLDNLEVIGQLVKNPTSGNKTGYTLDSWNEAIQEKRKQEKPHWVWIKKEIIGTNKTYVQQQELAKEECKKVSGANISGLIDTVVSVFMEYVRSGERTFVWDRVKEQYTFVRVNENTSVWRIRLGYASWGLYVLHCFDFNDESIGFALAWKSYGFERLNNLDIKAAD